MKDDLLARAKAALDSDGIDGLTAANLIAEMYDALRQATGADDQIIAAQVDAKKFPLPDWIDLPTWEAWMEVRVTARAKNTPRAKGLLLRDLDQLRAQGYDSTEVMEQSIKMGWRGAFPVKIATGQGGNRGNSRADELDRNLATLTGRA